MLTRAVTRGAERALVLADLPFGSYQVSDEDAVRNAIRFVKEAGADAVKLEGAGPSALPRGSRSSARASPSWATSGSLPSRRRCSAASGPRARRPRRRGQLLDDAVALEQAGCFALVLEAVPAPVAARVSEELTIPTIGIGSGTDCDGQVLVFHDLLGLYDRTSPRFTKRYAEIGGEIQDALERFAGEVRSGVFPTEEHTYAMPEDELAAFLSGSTAESRARR